MARLAGAGLRGETIFCTPTIIKAKPSLLGYYRLLLGFSQKSFFTAATGMTLFKPLETRARLHDNCVARLDELCLELNRAAMLLLSGIPPGLVGPDAFSDLSLLTLGAQLRGGANVKKGALGIARVFLMLREIVGHASPEITETSIAFVNSSLRRVQIEFAADPDIIIRESLSASDWRNVIAVEIKAGTDFSNIHNRVGEAEKSHQKARSAGYTECWTIVNVDPFDLVQAKKESPSTSRFYRLADLEKRSGAEYEGFKNRILALTGLAQVPLLPTKKIKR